MAAQRDIPVGSTNVMITVALRSSTTGQLLTGVAYGSVTYSYIKDGAATGETGTCITSTKGTWSDHGWVETDYAGLYQFGVPVACFSTTVRGVKIKLTAAGAIDAVIDIQIGADAVWNALLAGYTIAGSAAAALSTIQAKTDLITAGGKIVVVSPSYTDTDGTPRIQIVRGDSYETPYTVTVTVIVGTTILPNDITGLPVVLRYKVRGSTNAAIEVTGTITTAVGATKAFAFPLTPAQSNAMSPDADWICDVKVYLDAQKIKSKTVVVGASMIVKGDLR